MSSISQQINIRPYSTSDESDILKLWISYKLVVPQNDPIKDIECKLNTQPELFLLVGTLSDNVVASVMGGYDGHRGWIYYLAVEPEYQKQGIGRRMVDEIEQKLKGIGCQKLNLQVRTSNTSAITFYAHLGFSNDNVIGLGKRL